MAARRKGGHGHTAHIVLAEDVVIGDLANSEQVLDHIAVGCQHMAHVVSLDAAAHGAPSGRVDVDGVIALSPGIGNQLVRLLAEVLIDTCLAEALV